MCFEELKTVYITGRSMTVCFYSTALLHGVQFSVDYQEVLDKDISPQSFQNLCSNT